jgi:DNA invertase Pin-like site-specific DNA recombinase
MVVPNEDAINKALHDAEKRRKSVSGYRNDVIRVALYIRVSTDEQALRGYSLEAQEDALRAFAEENGYMIVGIYRDEGFSARKPVLRRPAMQELLADVEAKKVDMILFTKIDRWFRSVGDYHTVQRILDRYNVVWQAVLEKGYETATADGRLKVNIMLSVAENEADRTSERIRFVNRSKLEKREVFFNVPLGYKQEMIDGVRRMVKDPETEHIVNEFFARVLSSSIVQASNAINEKYGVDKDYKYWWHITKREAYTGTYKGIENFCPAYITKEQFDEINNKNRKIRRTKNNRIYLFSGLIRCPYCGHRLGAKYSIGRKKKLYSYYRCPSQVSQKCKMRVLPERIVEDFLLENIRKEMEGLLFAVDVQPKDQKQAKKQDEVPRLKEKLRRLNIAFFEGNIADDEYFKKAKAIKAKIAEEEATNTREEKPANLEAIKALLETDFERLYESMNKEERRRMWRSVIDLVIMDGTKPVGIKFKA